MEEIERESPRVAAALKEARLLSVDASVIAIQLTPGVHAQTVERRRPEIEAIGARVLGRPVRLSVKVGALPPAPAEPGTPPASIAQAEAAERQARSSAVREAARTHPNIREAARVLDGGIDKIEEL